jgi:hypothetical protein
MPGKGRAKPFCCVYLLERTGIPVSTETSAVQMPIPADGPSLGIAPSGKWMWMSLFW